MNMGQDPGRAEDMQAAWVLMLPYYSPPEVDRIWLWVYYNKSPIYPIFYLLKGDYRVLGLYWGLY